MTGTRCASGETEVLLPGRGVAPQSYLFSKMDSA